MPQILYQFYQLQKTMLQNIQLPFVQAIMQGNVVSMARVIKKSWLKILNNKELFCGSAYLSFI